VRKTLILLLVLGVLFLALGCDGEGSEEQAAFPTAILPDGWAVQVRLATTPEEQERGLMFVEHLPDDRGMLFIYEADGIRTFWMRNCKLPLDLIWVSDNGSVVDITPDTPPCPGDPCPTYSPGRPARYTLEVRAGLAAEHGVQVGDQILLLGL
jgi:uncharacterized membrane protein (UPF0127 family)